MKRNSRRDPRRRCSIAKIANACVVTLHMSDTAKSPITEWITQARAGDPVSERALWDHYFERVIRLARGRMLAMQCAVYDEEDAALSAIHSVFQGMRADRFPELNDRHNLWQMLVIITHRKVRAQWRRERASKRDPQREIEVGMDEILSTEPTADFVAEMMDDTQRLLGLLDDDMLRKIALLRMDGFTYDEIAAQLGCAVRTIYRKVERIRLIWDVDGGAG